MSREEIKAMTLKAHVDDLLSELVDKARIQGQWEAVQQLREDHLASPARMLPLSDVADLLERRLGLRE